MDDKLMQCFALATSLISAVAAVLAFMESGWKSTIRATLFVIGLAGVAYLALLGQKNGPAGSSAASVLLPQWGVLAPPELHPAPRLCCRWPRFRLRRRPRQLRPSPLPATRGLFPGDVPAAAPLYPARIQRTRTLESTRRHRSPRTMFDGRSLPIPCLPSSGRGAKAAAVALSERLLAGRSAGVPELPHPLFLVAKI